MSNLINLKNWWNSNYHSKINKFFNSLILLSKEQIKNLILVNLIEIIS
jgi:hypothetical protein